MTAGQTIILTSNAARSRAHRLIEQAAYRSVVKVEPERRNDAQNAKMWAMIADLVKQQPEGRKHSKDEWKNLGLAYAGVKGKFLPSLDGSGSMEYIAPSSSKLSKASFSDVIEALFEYGARHGVIWSDGE